MRVWKIDPAGVRRGMVEVTACTVVLRDCGLGTWQVETKDSTIGAGWRVLIPGVVSGPVTEVSVGIEGGHPVWTVTGVSELVALADRLTYPVPSKAASAQSDAAHWRATGPAETVIRDMVHLNAGPGALPSRRAKFFTVTASSGRGGTVSTAQRWGVLLDEARKLARLGGVTFDAIWEQASAQAVLRFRVPRDLSRRVRFGGPLGGLEDATVSLKAPTATAVVVAGQGQGTERTVYEYTAPVQWGRRIEVFKDQRQTNDVAELDKAGAEALADSAATGTASFKVAETKGLVYGTDYMLGDTVTVEVGGMRVTEPVRAVELAWDGHGRTASIVLGDHDQADDKDPAWLARVRRIEAQMRGLETI